MGKNIPTYNLNGISQAGFVIERIRETSHEIDDDIGHKGIHRDNHYLFLFLENGKAEAMVDFKNFKTEGPSIFCIMPGQVHYAGNFDINGWFLAVNPDLIPSEVRAAFEESPVSFSPVKIDPEFSVHLAGCAQLLYTYYKKEKTELNIVQSLLNAYTAMFTSLFIEKQEPVHAKESQAFTITRKFRILVKQQFRNLKSSSSYAEILNISPSYLTEVVKEITGKPAGYWIQQEIIIEAKRLLYYTDMSVKKIANELGYSDYSYFSRMFSKQANQSALHFRRKMKLNPQK